MIRTEKTIDYTDFPEEIRDFLKERYVDDGSSNGSYTYIEMYKEDGEENPVVDFLLGEGVKIGEDILLKISW